VERLTPGVEYHSVESIWIWGREFKLGEIRFSNAMTTTRNSLMPGSFGQVAYRETWSGTGGSPTPTYGGTARGGGERRWLSYNHIGNVVNTSNDAGALVESIDTDAYGNPLANAMTGAWASTLSERGLTTKELDPAAGMYYFYQRWYDPTTATFASRAPYVHQAEHPYLTNSQNPVKWNDPFGECDGGSYDMCLRRANRRAGDARDVADRDYSRRTVTGGAIMMGGAIVGGLTCWTGIGAAAGVTAFGAGGVISIDAGLDYMRENDRINRQRRRDGQICDEDCPDSPSNSNQNEGAVECDTCAA